MKGGHLFLYIISEEIGVVAFDKSRLIRRVVMVVWVLPAVCVAYSLVGYLQA